MTPAEHAAPPKEVWRNVYDGTDVKRGPTTTAWVVEALEPLLPSPVISPTCAKRGHDWTPFIAVLHKDSTVAACRRCFRRGLLVIETRAK